MAPAVIELHQVDDTRDAVHRAVEALAEGRLVVFPTETVYGVAASALHDTGVDRLLEAKGRPAGQPLALALKSADDVADFVPFPPPLVQRLARRCWPGPVTLVVDDNHRDSAARQLPERVRQAVLPEGTIGLRVPAHAAVLSVLRLSAGPLALSSANRSGQPAPVTAAEAVAQLGDDVALVLDDGRCRFAAPSSVVQVRGNRWQLLREGVLNLQTVQRLSHHMILFVCTGNTCRSPMAAALMRRKLARLWNQPADQLEDRGVSVLSAGIAALPGSPASSESVEVMKSEGIDLSGHESQPLSDRLVRFADLIFTMTRAHREAIVSRWPQAADRTLVLNDDGGDISDPIGGPLEVYRRCAQQIDETIDRRLRELDFSQLTPAEGIPPAAAPDDQVPADDPSGPRKE